MWWKPTERKHSDQYLNKWEFYSFLYLLQNICCTTHVYLRHKQGPGINDIYEVSQATEERTLQETTEHWDAAERAQKTSSVHLQTDAQQ